MIRVMGRPFAYLRKSRVLRGAEIISPEMQLAAATEYARQFGDENLVVLTDLNKSGRKGRLGRPGFDALLSAIEADEVSAIYSYSLSRLSRSVRDIMALAELCRSRGVPIRLARDTDPDPTTATGRAILALLGVMAQLEADLASERATDAVEARRARGDKMGGPVYKDHEAVLAAFHEAGSCTGAARLLNLREVPTLRGMGPWFPSSVRVVIDRVQPGLIPPSGPHRGSKPQAPFMFYRLLRCHCGTILTGMRSSAGYTAYRCTRGRVHWRHGKKHIPETVVLEWAKEEAARMRLPSDLVALGEANAAGRAAVLERLERIRVAWVNGMYPDEATMLADKEEAAEALTQLDLQGRVVMLPPVRWNRPPVEVNRTLHALWSHVQLGPNYETAEAEWLLPPTWLAPRPDGSGQGSPAALRGRRRKAT